MQTNWALNYLFVIGDFPDAMHALYGLCAWAVLVVIASQILLNCLRASIKLARLRLALRRRALSRAGVL